MCAESAPCGVVLARAIYIRGSLVRVIVDDCGPHQISYLHVATHSEHR